MEFVPTFFSSFICPNITKMTTGKLFFYQMTGQKKYALSKSEYEILTDPYDVQMVIFYQYLLYIIYRRQIPCTAYHFKYMKDMLNILEKKQKDKTKKLEKNKKNYWEK